MELMIAKIDIFFFFFVYLRIVMYYIISFSRDRNREKKKHKSGRNSVKTCVAKKEVVASFILVEKNKSAN